MRVRPFCMRVSMDLMCDLEAFRDTVDANIDAIPKRVRSLAIDHLQKDVLLLDLMDLLVNEKARWPLAAQLFTCIGLSLDARCVALFEGPAGAMKGRLSAKVVNEERCVMNNPSYMQLYLAACVEGAKKNAAEAKFVSIATDTGRIHGRNVALAAMVLPDNTASWLPPQAPLEMARFRRLPARAQGEIGFRKPTPRVGFQSRKNWFPSFFPRLFLVPAPRGGGLN